MKLAGKPPRRTHRCISAIAIYLAAATCLAQQAPVRTTAPAAPGTPAPAIVSPTASADPLSSLTIEQIVARQEAHFDKIRNAQGTAVHSETRYNEQGQPQPPTTQYIFFAYEGDKSVTLAMPKKAAEFYKSAQGQIPWNHITSAFHIAGDTVYNIRKPEAGTSVPTVMAIPFNPAVHENNPLVMFHPRQISDEQIPLRDLARAVPNMAQRPQVYDVRKDGRLYLRVEFANPNTPGERLYYVVDPARGYLPTEIARTSNNKAVSVSKIIIGHTPDGTWIPARRERVIYNAQGKPASRQQWHYEYFAINEKLAPKILSLMYFNLPLNMPVTLVNDGTIPTTATRRAQSSRPNTPTGQRTSPARTTPQTRPQAPSATPIPPRIAPAPMRVPL